jgi:hypothetical protein
VATVAGAYGVRGYVAAQDAAATASPAALAAADPTVDPTLAPEAENGPAGGARLWFELPAASAAPVRAESGSTDPKTLAVERWRR